jgi:tRNA (cytidine/uridine-2'-O-)-methyltransferase
MHVVLIEPEIPQNTGSIARVCAGTGVDLHLVGRLGFSLADRYLKRAGLDYWPSVKLHVWDTFDALRASARSGARFFYFSARATKPYCDVRYEDGDYLVFGRETVGLPRALLEREGESVYTIPHASTIRSINLSNAVSVVLYEALRQTDFAAISRARVVAEGAEGPAFLVPQEGSGDEATPREADDGVDLAERIPAPPSRRC